MTLIEQFEESIAARVQALSDGDDSEFEVCSMEADKAREALLDQIQAMQAERDQWKNDALNGANAIEALQAENESLRNGVLDLQTQLALTCSKLVPLTQEQVVEGFCKTPHQVQYVAVFDAGVRFAEAAHGIQAKGGQHEDA